MGFSARDEEVGIKAVLDEDWKSLLILVYRDLEVA